MEKKAEYSLTRDETYKNYNEIKSKVVVITRRNIALTEEVMARIRFLDEKTRSNISVTMFTAMVAILLSNSWSMDGLAKKIGYVQNNFLFLDTAITKSKCNPTDEDIMLDMYRYARMILATKDKNKIGF